MEDSFLSYFSVILFCKVERREGDEEVRATRVATSFETVGTVEDKRGLWGRGGLGLAGCGCVAGGEG